MVVTDRAVGGGDEVCEDPSDLPEAHLGGGLLHGRVLGGKGHTLTGVRPL